MKHSYLLLFAMCFCFGCAFAQYTPYYPQKDTVLLMPGKGVVIYISGDTIYSRLDTANPDAYNIKKKKHHQKQDQYHSHKLDSLLGDIWIQANDAHTSSDDLIIRGKDVQLGGQLPKLKAINFDSFYLTSHGLIPKYKDSIYSIKGYNWDFWQTPVEAYPWWKKALWSLFGAVVLAVSVFFIVLFTEPKNIDL